MLIGLENAGTRLTFFWKTEKVRSTERFEEEGKGLGRPSLEH
jgi:hypothetical protein